MSGGRPKARYEFLAVVLCAAALIWPLFKTKYLEEWGSIDSTFIADARFLAEHGPYPGWQPLWYGGTRFDYIYPPAIRYVPAAMIKLFGLVPGRAYHLYTAICYALGIGGVWLMVYAGTRSRNRAWLAAAGAAVLSPSLLLLAEVRHDQPFYMPQRLNVLIRYGEGPHMSALAMLPFVFAAAWFGLRRNRPGMLVLAAVAAAAVVSNNFYGATALALFFPILCWAVFLETGDRAVWLRAAGIAALAYGLTAFWLTPTYLQITQRNLAIVSQPGNAWSMATALVLAAGFAAASWRWARGREDRSWMVFVAGGTLFIALNTFGHALAGFRIAGEPQRLVPECDLFLVLAGCELARQVWRRQRVVAAVVLVAAFLPAAGYLRRPWRPIVRTSEYKHLTEYKLAEWVATHRPEARAYVTGTVRFWWNAWFNTAQIGGGSEQGITNFDLMPMYWHVNMAETAGMDVEWLQATGTDLVVVNDERSKLPYRDIVKPHKWDGVLPTLFDDGQGNWIVEVPRRWRSLARVVRRAEVDPLLPPRHGDDRERLAPYVHALEQGPEAPSATRWRDSRTLQIDAPVGEGEAVIAQVSYDPAWRATAGGQELPVSRDPIGQVRIDAPAGTRQIELRWSTPKENVMGRVMFGVAILAGAGLLWRRRR